MAKATGAREGEDAAVGSREGLQARSGPRGAERSCSTWPPQGGFVELSLAEPGHYPFLPHVMADAEMGERGILAVPG